MKRLPLKAIQEYFDAVSRYGPRSAQAQAVRRKCVSLEGFKKFADTLDEIKTSVGGRGIEYRYDGAATKIEA